MQELQKHAPDWPGVQKLSAVQSMLDRNKLLIAEINKNQELRDPDALQRNVILIKELNSNIVKVVHTYQELVPMLDTPQPSAQPASSMQTT